MFIVDAHLDLGENAIRGRDLTRPAAEQTPDADGTPSVGLPDLRRGGVGLICGTVFCEPASDTAPTGYHTAAEAAAMAREQLAWYHRQADAGEIRLVLSRSQVPTGDLSIKQPEISPATILLLEGADAIEDATDVGKWYREGVRIVGLAWHQTRYAGGTGHPGPLTPQGVQLVAALDQAGMIHDVSHLAEESFWQLLDHATGPIIASHSNCRSLIATDRQLSDEMITALVARGAVIGVNFYDRFLARPGRQPDHHATLGDIVDQVRHLCQVSGDETHVGLGTDMDGGFGRENLPDGLSTSADLPAVGEALSAGGFGDEQIAAIMGGNWLRFFRHTLPAGGPGSHSSSAA